MEKLTVALYIRLSVEDIRTESQSIENQEKFLRKYVSNLKEYENANVLEFVDNGYSGTNFERPKAQELLEMVRNNKIECIIVKDFSRFSRNALEAGYFIEKVFPIFRTRFIAITDNYDSNNYKEDTGGVNVSFKYLINEYYSTDISNKTKSAAHIKMNSGTYVKIDCVYGYKKGADSRLEIDDEAANVVKKIYELYLEGLNCKEISKKLYVEKIFIPAIYKKVRDGKQVEINEGSYMWKKGTVNNILKDERYIGTYVTGKSEVKAVGSKEVVRKNENEWIRIAENHEPIIDKDIFETVQNLRSKKGFKKVNKRTNIKAKDSTPVHGKVYCGICGHKMSKDKDRFCCGYSQSAEELECNGLLIKIKELEESVFAILKQQLEIELGSVLGNISQFNAYDFEKQIVESLQNDIDYYDNCKVIAYEQYIEGTLSLEEFKSKNETYREKSEQLRVQQNKQLKRQNIDAQRKLLQQTSKELISENNRSTMTKEMINSLIDRIEVFPGAKIEILFKFQ